MISLRQKLLSGLAALCGLLGGTMSGAGTLPFQFTLDEAATTSAGVFQKDGTLVRTLWRKVDYAKGDHAAVWDGMTDDQGAAAPGDYSIRVLSNHVDYVWQGSIGNTSTAPFGSTVHRGFNPVRSLVITGTDAFYTAGYCEGDFDFRHFSTTNPQQVDDRWCWYYNSATKQTVSNSATIYASDWNGVATDGTWVYFSAPDSTDPSSRAQHVGPGIIVASLVSTHQSATFTNGKSIPNGPSNFPNYPSGIYVGKQKGLSGMAVEKNGNTLAASVASENKIYFFDKRSGAPIGNLSVPSPGAMAFSPNGDLWAISATSVLKITTPAVSPAISHPIGTLSEPLDLAVDPQGIFVAVVDGGGSQQIKTFAIDGTPGWTLGQPGGYLANGPEVTRDKFSFFDVAMAHRGNVTFAPDGSFWVNDPGNKRTLHFAADRSYLEEIMFQNVSYSSGVDAHNPQRVFSDFLEFAVDYSQPLAQGWKLVRNWSANLPQSYFGFNSGIRDISTLANGRTYGVVVNGAAYGREFVELTPQGIRLTGLILADSRVTQGKFEAFLGNGNVRRGTLLVDGSAAATSGQRSVFEEKTLIGFDAQNNPQWGDYTTLADVPAGQTDPVTRCCSLGDNHLPSTSSDVLVSFDPTVNAGWHLGGVKKGCSSWLWKASPSVTSNVPLDGLGSFDIGDGVNYPGNTVFTIGRSILFGYHGEFWNQSQACQFMHFYDDGLFVGQFGESGWGHDEYEVAVPGRAGNSAFSCVTEVNGVSYLWANDESEHGPQRWLISGDKTIRETSATGTLGQTTPLLVPAATSPFPTNLLAQPGDGRVSLTWNPVAGALFYTIRLATSRGGNSTLIAGKVAGTGKTISQLSNGQSYYFTVSAIGPAGESVVSDPAMAVPVSASMTAEIAGRYDQTGTQPATLNVFPDAPALGQPALKKLNPLYGNLALRDVGSAGYKLFCWDPKTSADVTNLPAGDQIDLKDGWKPLNYLGYRFNLGGTNGANVGQSVASGSTGTIHVTPGDSSLHYLTVVMPARFRDAVAYQISLAGSDGTSPPAVYQTRDVRGLDHIYQFRFRGPVDLAVQCQIGTAAVLGIFLDLLPQIPPGSSGYSLWSKQNFAATTGATPDLLAPEADFDGDGQSNLTEYALGSSPTDSQSINPIVSGIQAIDGNYYLVLKFIRDRSATDVSLQVGSSSQLSDPNGWTWVDAADPRYLISDQLDVPAKGLETMVVRDILPASGGARFMKISVSPTWNNPTLAFQSQ